MNKYNGWSNYETWNFMLWYGERIYNEIEWEGLEGTPDEVKEIVTLIVEDLHNSVSDTGFTTDIFNNAISNININEIIESVSEQ